MAAVNVEWGSTGFVTYHTMMHIGEGDYVEVDPDSGSVTAKLETRAVEPAEVQVLTVVRKAEGVFLAKFHADKALYNVGDQFYITLYWQYDGVQMCERVPAQIHTDL